MRAMPKRFPKPKPHEFQVTLKVDADWKTSPYKPVQNLLNAIGRRGGSHATKYAYLYTLHESAEQTDALPAAL